MRFVNKSEQSWLSHPTFHAAASCVRVSEVRERKALLTASAIRGPISLFFGLVFARYFRISLFILEFALLAILLFIHDPPCMEYHESPCFMIDNVL